MSKGTYSHSNRHRMHGPQDVPFLITEASNIGKSFWRERIASRKTVDELLKENEELKKDKERLDWLIDHAYIHFYRVDDGGEWEMELDASDARNHIDKEMEEAP